MKQRNYFKVRMMSIAQLILFDALLSVILIYRKLPVLLPNLILTPDGIKLNRRHPRRRYHMIPERRTENIIARFFQDLLEVEP